MPYQSLAQERWAHTKQGESALGGPNQVAEWDHASRGKNLPARAMAHGGLVGDDMNDMDIKKTVLQQIIDAMTGHQLRGLKKKGAKPSVMEVSVEKHDALPLPGAEHDKPAEAPGADDDESPDVLQSLHDMYSKDDDDDAAC